ncbi:MAG: hypothetical protein AB1327_02580 [Bacillota bacterium]|uniref:hypothetical protein n=1 Tax=Desulforudis sp. DRI-14 TaxID=3459793 RepID=UPI00348571C6
MDTEQKLDLKDVVLIGRTFDEYYRMFALDDLNPQTQRILDVASGVSSFCPEANSRGFNVIASDRIYRFSPYEIEEKCRKDLETVLTKLAEVMDLYNWDFFKTVDDLRAAREKAYKLFVDDFKLQGNKRYVFTEYPHSSFKDNQFDVSLVSHFLFLYDEHLDYGFHKNTILELIRVSSEEVCIFPLVNLRGKSRYLLRNCLKIPTFVHFGWQ